MFENGQIVERFLDFWRRSGNQRIGFLIGKYEPFEGAPLGIKAVVSAIYEPPQVRVDLGQILKKRNQFSYAYFIDFVFAQRNPLSAVSI